MRLIGPVLVALLVVALAAASCRKEAPPVPPPPPPSLIPPLHDAAVGEWLRVQAGVDTEMYRVVGATDYEVSVEYTPYHDDAPSESPRILTWSRNGFSLPADKSVIRAIEADRIEVGGKWYDCWRLSVFTHEVGIPQRLFWICDQIPVHGLLKIANVVKGQIDEVHAVRLVDWGPK